MSKLLSVLWCAAVASAMACGDNAAVRFDGAPAEVDAPTGVLPDGANPDGAMVDADPAMPDADVSGDQIAVARVLPWTGNGLQLLVELPAGALVTDETWVETLDGVRTDAVVASAGVTSGMTSILVVPSTDAAIHADRLAAAAALITALPADERVAVFVARTIVAAVADLSVDRSHALLQLAAIAPEAGAPAAVAVPQVRDLLAQAESRYTTPGRTVIVIGDSATDEPADQRRPVQTLTMAVSANPVDDAAAVIAELATRRTALVRIGACASYADSAAFTLHLGSAHAALLAPTPFEHLLGETCTAEAAAADAFSFPTQIDLTLSAAERPIYDDAYNFQSEAAWRTSVTLGAGLPVPAEAHFRGQATLGCERKSMTIKLDGERKRLMPKLASDRFFLVSMCQDTRYFGQVWGNKLLATLGLFPMQMRYVRVRVDGVNLGVYLMIQQPEDTLRDDGLATSTVVRRRYDIYGQPAEVKFPDDPIEATAAAARFEEIGDLALNAPVETLDATLAARIDLDAYFRILATFSLLENGDYIDEAFFYASNETGGEFYRTSGWDTDDIQSLCHGGGGAAIADACGLTYCAEAELDHAMLRAPEVYQRYLDALGDVLNRITPALIASTMNEVRADLFAVLDSDETAAALHEMLAENPSANTEATAEADIGQYMDSFLVVAENRRAVLTAGLSTCAP